MEVKGPDPEEFRSGQREQWDTAASGWTKWQELIERGTHGVSERLVELAGVERGSRVLDVAAGYGEPTLTAARRAGEEGSVVATDISPEMVARGRERLAAEGAKNVEYVEADAASLDYPAESFDAALSRWGIIFDPDGEGAAGRVRGFLKPEGRFAISSWGPADKVPMLGIPMKTAMRRADVSPPPPGTPGPLSRPSLEAISGLLEAGGFSDVSAEEIEVVLKYESPEDFTTFVREIAPPVSSLLAPLPEKTQREAWEEITEVARAQADDDGTLTLSNVALVASGRA